MLIGIDASRANITEKTGVEWYGYHVIKELAKLDHSNRYRLYSWEPLTGGLSGLPDNFENVVVPNRRFWPHTALSAELKRNPVDRLFIPSHIVPRVHPERTTVAIHDLGFRQFRANYTRYHYLSLSLGTKWSAKWAHQILALSQTVAGEIAHTYDVAPSKITVVPPGYDPAMFKGVTSGVVMDVLGEYHVKDPYLLYLGRLESRKNVTRLIEAFYRLTDSGLFGGQLVLAGHPGVGYEEIRALIGKQRYAGQVVHTGYVSDRARAALLRGARAFVFPSLHEGFGIPILEAFAAGTPVLTSKQGATAEVATGAAWLVDPESVEEIHHGMQQLLSDQPLVERLTAAGAERLRHYGWDKTAAAVHRVLAS